MTASPFRLAEIGTANRFALARSHNSRTLWASPNESSFAVSTSWTFSLRLEVRSHPENCRGRYCPVAAEGYEPSLWTSSPCDKTISDRIGIFDVQKIQFNDWRSGR